MPLWYTCRRTAFLLGDERNHMPGPTDQDNKTPKSSADTGTRTLGHYRLLRRLGAGGMGEVYLAEDTTLQRRAAVKLLPAEVAADPAWRQRFLREARTASALNHPSIATVYEAGFENETAYIAMEYVEGSTLRERLARPLPLREAVSIARQVARALSAAHHAGVVHGDIKPENVMLTLEGAAKVLDFGIARRARPAAGTAETVTAPTSESSFSGTPGYTAPEQLEPGEVDARADLFALGTVLYEMLAGRRAFAGKNFIEVSHAVLNQTPPPLESLRRETPLRLARVVARCLEKERAARYQCAADLALDLETTLEEVPAPQPALAASRWRSPWLPVAALLVGVLLGASALLWRAPKRTYWKLPASPPVPVLRQPGQVFHAALASDGNQFVYVLHDELYLQEIAGGDPRKLTSDELPKVLPRFSPDGKRILFERRTREGENPALYVLDLPAGIPRLLIEDAARGVWSPDGTKIAFVRPSTREAFVADGEGRLLSSLGPAQSTTPPWFSSLSWAPDGSGLALVHKGELHIVSADGRSRHEVPVLLPGIKRAAGVAFTPDGDFLLVNIGGGGYVGLWQLPRRGGPAVPFSVIPYELTSPTISQDGSKLLAVMGRTEFDVVVSELAPEALPGQFRQLTFGGWEIYPALSPDEKRIVYVTWVGWDLWTVNVDGTDARKLLTGHPALPGYPAHPAWSSDGRTLVFFTATKQPELWTLRLNEGVPRRFSTINGDKTYPSFVADGNSVVFEVFRNSQRDVWLAPAEGGEGRPLTTDGASRMPRAAPLGTAVAYLRERGPDTYEVRVLDYVTGQGRVVVTGDALAQFGKFNAHPPRWSRDARYLFLATEAGLLRIRIEGGTLERFSFSLPSRELVPCFDVFSDSKKVLFGREALTVQPWLYPALR